MTSSPLIIRHTWADDQVGMPTISSHHFISAMPELGAGNPDDHMEWDLEHAADWNTQTSGTLS